MLPRTKGFVKCFDETKYKSFSIKDGESLKKYNKTWNKVSNIVKKKFDKIPKYLNI